jgi:FecR protein
MASRLISAQSALALATVGLVLGTGPAICQSVGKAAAVNPAASSSSGRILTLGSEIIHKERVRTDTGGSVQLLFIDRTTMNIGPNSDVLIDEYVFDPQTNTGKMSVSLGKGLMRFVGGQISHQGNAQVKTPTATIGIRGAVGSFSYDPVTKITSASNDCRACVLTLLAPNGQTVQIPPGQTATVQNNGSISIAPTTKQDTERNLRATQSKSGQTGGAGKNTSQMAAGLGSKPLQTGNFVPPSPGVGFTGNQSTVQEITQTMQTTSGNTGAKVSQPPRPSPPPPPPPPPPPCKPTARGCF